ncbi:MAG: UDP-N-acetylmuramate--L-alanine ligase [Bacteroidia bacterium]
MNLDNIHNIFFVGIGGIGMSALARYFKAQEKNVVGYDRTETELTKELQSESIDVHFTDDVNLIPSSFNIENTLVIYTPAVPKEHKQLMYFQKNNFNIVKRAAALGEISKNYTTFAVAGTHGKTTTSTLLAHILSTSNEKCNAFLGGISSNYNSNFLLEKNSKNVVVEADEFDRSFLQLNPNYAIVTSTDADHLDIYQSIDSVKKSFQEFANLVSEICVAKKGIGITRNHISYSITDNAANYFATNIRIENHHYSFDAITPNETIKNIVCGLPGRHNVENALAALALSLEVGIEKEIIVEAIKTYKGVKRRFDYQINTNEKVYIDDYAHHPEEIKAFVNSVKELYPKEKITGIFQPHLYSRTKDFAEDFATSLSLLDSLCLVPIYPARELPIEGVTSNWLLSLVDINDKHFCEKKDILNWIEKTNPKVLLTMGAGDIDQFVEPIKQQLSKTTKNVA